SCRLPSVLSGERGARTRAVLRPLRPERSASTSSTTSARAEKLVRRRGGINPGHDLRARWGRAEFAPPGKLRPPEDSGDRKGHESLGRHIGLTLPKWWPILCLGR